MCICLVPDCNLQVQSRGLCGTCYQMARQHVLKNETTWEELEALGLAAPTKRRASGKRGLFTAALDAKSADQPTPEAEDTDRAFAAEPASPLGPIDGDLGPPRTEPDSPLAAAPAEPTSLPSLTGEEFAERIFAADAVSKAARTPDESADGVSLIYQDSSAQPMSPNSRPNPTGCQVDPLGPLLQFTAEEKKNHIAAMKFLRKDDSADEPELPVELSRPQTREAPRQQAPDSGPTDKRTHTAHGSLPPSIDVCDSPELMAAAKDGKDGGVIHVPAESDDSEPAAKRGRLRPWQK